MQKDFTICLDKYFLFWFSMCFMILKVDGGWSDWGNWSLCTRVFNGIQMRTRECVNPKPQFGRIKCKGSTTVMRGCTNTSSCLQESPVRFQTEGSPSTGVMQIHKNNTWKALCTANWNNTEAILACQVNGYNYSNDNFTGNWKRGNTSLVNITSHSCSSVIQSCGFINTQIQCSVPVRLSGAKVKYGGRVEVFYRRRWGKICRTKWDISDAKVVCKQLGFRGALAEFMTGMNTTDEDIPVVMSDIACTGQESVLAQCNRLDGEHKCPEDIGAQALCVPNDVEVLEKKSLSSNLGSTETVQCSLEKENQNGKVKWYKIGTTTSELNSDGRIEVKGVTLTIKNVQLADGGTYECRGEGYTRFYTVYVNARFKDEKPQQPLVYGKPGKIRCTAEGNPPPQFEWRKNDSLLLEKDRFTQLSDGSLQIDKVGREDKGAYKCSIKQTKGSERITVYSQVINVSVIVAPVVYVSPQNQTVVEGQTTNISCKASGVPHPRLSWKFENRELPRDAVITNTSNQSLLQLPKTVKNMEGWYKCIAKNEAGEEYSISSLHVLEFPTAEISPNPYPTMLEGDTLTLTCKANEATWRITWEKNNVSKIQRANITENGDSSILLIEKVEVSDSGEYSCKVLNKAGSASSSVDIKIRGHQEQNSPKTRPATRAIEWYYIVGPFSAVLLSALIIWYLCKRRMTATARSQGAEEEHEMEVLNVEVDAWEIARGQIALEEVIGSGAFGTVWRATLSRENGQPGIRFVAAKCFSPTSGDEGRTALMREIGLGKVIGDSPQPNIVQFIGCVTTQIQPILIMEYLPCGDLLGYLRKSRGIFDKHYGGKLAVAPLKTYDLLSFSNQIATGMVFLASRGIVHRGLAARNVLLDQNRVCKVTDFGLSYQNFKYEHGNAKKGCMPIKWTAPEIIFGDPANLSSKSDVWSYGVVLYEIFTIGGIPYPGWSEGKTMEELKRGYRMPKPAHIANNLYNLMEMCWQEIPVLRPDFVNISKRLRSFIEGEYLPLVDESKYNGAKYSGVEDVGAETEDDARAVRGATNAKASTRKWSSLKL